MKFAIVLLAGILLGFPTLAADCSDARDLRLVNGRIYTMDARNTIVAEVTIQNGRFEAVGKTANQKLSPCTKTINLGKGDPLAQREFIDGLFGLTI